MKILIIGHAGHGKDTAAEYLKEQFQLTYSSSSEMANKLFLFDMLKDIYGYKTEQECFDDRGNKRAIWYDAICKFNTPNKTRLAECIIEKHDCYVGMRSIDEYNECYNQNMFDMVVFVDASERLPKEDESSFTIPKSVADVVIENNGTIEEFKRKLFRQFYNAYYKFKLIYSGQTNVYALFENVLDHMENHTHKAIMKHLIGVTTSKREAELVCNRGKTYTSDDCWAVVGSLNQYFYKETPIVNCEDMMYSIIYREMTEYFSRNSVGNVSVKHFTVRKSSNTYYIRGLSGSGFGSSYKDYTRTPDEALSNKLQQLQARLGVAIVYG